MFIKHILTFSLLTTLFIPALNSWWNTGHYLIAQIAENNLTPKTKLKVNKLLKEEIIYPGTLLCSQNTSSFLEASTWCDYIKNYEWLESKNKKVNSMLHYINPNTNVRQKVTKNSSKAGIKHLISSNSDSGKYNSFTGLLGSIKTLSNPTSPEADKAVALRFVIHLLGDIHTPLHNTALLINSFDTRGGNKILLKPEIVIREFSNSKKTKTEKVDNMHSFGDAAGGAFYQIPYSSKHAKRLKISEKNYLRSEAKKIVSKYHDNERTSNRITNSSISSWFIESNMIAGYLVNTSKLKYYRTSKKGKEKIYVKFRKPKKYIETVQNISLEQIYIAGIRLSKLLNAIFDPENSDKGYIQQIQKISKNSKFADLNNLFPKKINFQIK